MFHRNLVQTNRIWTQEPVYQDSSLGNLDRTQVGEIVSFPLQDRFNSDGKARFSVTVYSHTTLLAFIQCIISRLMSIIHCTAVRTPFRSVVSINLIKGDLKHFAIRFKEFFEFSIRYSINLSVGFFVKLSFSAFQILQFFNRNISIIRLSKINNFFGNLTASCLNKIELFMLKPFKTLLRPTRTFVSKALKMCSSFKISSLHFSNIFSKINLFDNFGSLDIKDSYRSKDRRTYIHTDNIFLVNFWFDKSFFKNNRYSTIFQKRNIMKNPFIIKKESKSFKLSVGFDRNYKRFIRRIGNLKTRISSFRVDVFEPSFIKTNRSILKSVFYCLSLSPNIFSGFLNNIRWQKGGFSYV